MDKQQKPAETVVKNQENGSSQDSSPSESRGWVITTSTIVVLFIFAFGIWIRFQDLEKMAYHHDESIHAYYSWQLYKKGPYHPDMKAYPVYYDPVYHGPFLYHAGALSFLLFGDNDFTGRLPFAVSGIVLMLFAYQLRHFVGKRTAILILLLVSVSPVLSYFARFARNDTYVGAECMALIYCALRYFQASKPESKNRWLYGVVFCLALHYATKENSYAHGAIYCGFLGLYFLWRLVASRFKAGAFQALMRQTFVENGSFTALYVLYGWFSFFMFTYVYTDVFGAEKTPPFHYTKSTWAVYWIVALVVLFILQFFLAWMRRRYAEPPPGGGRNVRDALIEGFLANVPLALFLAIVLGEWFIAVIFGVSVLLFAGWMLRSALERSPGEASRSDSKKPYSVFDVMFKALLTHYAYYVAIFIVLVVYCLLFTTLGGNFGIKSGQGLRDGVYEYVAHWMKIHDKPRIPGPSWYYLPRLLLYETLGVATWFLALVVYLVWAILDADKKTARPKMYWPFRFFLLLYAPLAILIYSRLQEKVPWLLVHQALPLLLLAGVFWGDVWERIRYRAIHVIAGIFFVFFALWSLRANVLLNCYNNDDPKEIMVYTQTNQNVKKILREIEQIGYLTAKEKNLRITVKGDAQWPFSWYLRNYTNWTIMIDPNAPVIITDEGDRMRMRATLRNAYTMRKYDFRTHWTPDARKLFREKDKFWKRLWDYALYRTAWGDSGSPYILMYVKKDLVETALPAEKEDLPEGWDQAPQRGIFVRSFGTRGRGSSQFVEPRGIAFGPNGEFYVADTKNARIQKFSADGRFLLSWGQPGKNPGEFEAGWSGPAGVAVGPDGSVYVADTWNNRIQKFTSDGKFVRMWGGATSNFFGPRALATDPEGNVYVVDTGNKRVQKFDKDGNFIRQWGTAGALPQEFNEPVGIAIGTDGLVYIADTGNQRIQILDRDGKFQRQIQLLAWDTSDTVGIEPYLALDRVGRIYVTDSVSGVVLQISPDGKKVVTWGMQGSGPGQFEKPLGIAVSPADEIYVTDRSLCRVSIFKPR